jgi:hypothetical protein
VRDGILDVAFRPDEAGTPAWGTLMYRRAALILCASLVAGCSAQPPAGGGSQGVATQTPPIAASSEGANPAGTGTSVAHVEVASGKLAGTYDASGSKLDCNMSPGGSGATFSDLAKAKGFNGLTFTSAEGGSNPAKFYFQVGFADPTAGILQQPGLEVDTLTGAAKGHGTAKLEDKGGTIKWTFDGATADGIGVKATIECGPVDRR